MLRLHIDHPVNGKKSQFCVAHDRRPIPIGGYAAYSLWAILSLECPAMRYQLTNSHLPVCWLRSLVCPRRYRAVLPSRLRPNLFGSD
jgi:hypothetical protein